MQLSGVEREAEGADRPWRQSGGGDKNGGYNNKNRNDNGKKWGDKGASGISRILEAAKLQSALRGPISRAIRR